MSNPPVKIAEHDNMWTEKWNTTGYLGQGHYAVILHWTHCILSSCIAWSRLRAMASMVRNAISIGITPSAKQSFHIAPACHRLACCLYYFPECSQNNIDATNNMFNAILQYNSTLLANATSRCVNVICIVSVIHLYLYLYNPGLNLVS